MKPTPDLTGLRFRFLSVLNINKDKYNRTVWDCLCDCGKSTTVRTYDLKNGTVVSCGCYSAKKIGDFQRKHGMYNTIEYSTWEGIKQRCLNEKNDGYLHYGGRGIKICLRWQNSFEDFYIDMGPRPSKYHSIERKNVDGDYEPGNCIWILKIDQGKNKRNSLTLEINGEVKLIIDWCKHYNIPIQLVKGRLKRGWFNSIETLFEPPKCKAWNSKDSDIKLYDINGIKKRLRRWCKDYNIEYKAVWGRMNKFGWDLQRALTTPIRKQINNKY